MLGVLHLVGVGPAVGSAEVAKEDDDRLLGSLAVDDLGKRQAGPIRRHDADRLKGGGLDDLVIDLDAPLHALRPLRADSEVMVIAPDVTTRLNCRPVTCDSGASEGLLRRNLPA